MQIHWRLFSLAGASIVFLFLATGPADADIGFELYSWKAGSAWNYSIFEGTGTTRSNDAIRAKKNRLKDKAYLKGRIAQLPSRERLYWREKEADGFVLPPKEVIQEIDTYTTTCGLQLFLPSENADARTLKLLQNEAKEVMDLGD